MNIVEIFTKYIEDIRKDFSTGAATEHTYRPALKTLFESLAPGTIAVNEPKRQKLGAPDFQIESTTNHTLRQFSQSALFSSAPLAFVEHKDLAENLDKPEHQDQLKRYLRLGNVLHTNGLVFRFYIKDQKPLEIVLAELVAGNQIVVDSAKYQQLSLAYKELIEARGLTIRTPLKLATMMAERAQAIRDIIEAALLQDLTSGQPTDLGSQYHTFKRQLIHDLTEKQFADLYAQTLAYGLFAARYNDDTLKDFSLEEAAKKLPQTNQFLRKFFHEIAGYEHDIRLNWVLDNFVEIFNRVDVRKLMFGAGEDWAKHHDPIIHFYETFLKLYDPVARKNMGVYYTPKPVVQYIVRAVDEILKSEFGLSDGLASNEKIEQEYKTQPVTPADKKRGYAVAKRQVHKVQILDPALGTGTFLNEIINHVAAKMKPKLGSGWSKYVESDLLKRLYGFELMMAPYAMAHLRLNLTLAEHGYKPVSRNQRLQVYLTNSLEEPAGDELNQLQFVGFQQILASESQEADIVKRNRSVMVVLGNPPYSVSSNNKSKFIEDLLKDYKKDLNERNIQPLSDDYIKFIRFASHMIEENGEGIMAMITNNSYVDGLIHRQMRKHLIQTFDKLYVLDLHGNSKKKDAAADGGKDENVFDIQQGVAILIGVKTGDPRGAGDKLAKVYKSDLYGKRPAKLKVLETANLHKNNTLLEVDSLRSLFKASNVELKKEYDSFVSLENLFKEKSAGIQTKRDLLFIDFDKVSLAERIKQLINSDYDEEFVKTYNIKDSSSYRLLEKIKIAQFKDSNIVKFAYRPFDFRYIYYDKKLLGRPFYNIMRTMLEGKRIAILTSKMTKGSNISHFLVTDSISEMKTAESSTQSFHLPLYLLDGVNFNTLQLEKLIYNINREYTPEDIFDYIYATLHSHTYRTKYKEFLKSDFPRIPIPKNDDEFVALKNLGTQLRIAHLMEDTGPTQQNYTPTDEVPGNWTVEKPMFVPTSNADGKVYVNPHQYFADVPKIAWEFYVGGYQPAQKWLKVRKGRELSSDDLLHYQKIIAALVKTDGLMKEIDSVAKF